MTKTNAINYIIWKIRTSSYYQNEERVSVSEYLGEVFTEEQINAIDEMIKKYKMKSGNMEFGEFQDVVEFVNKNFKK